MCGAVGSGWGMDSEKFSWLASARRFLKPFLQTRTRRQVHDNRDTVQQELSAEAVFAIDTYKKDSSRWLQRTLRVFQHCALLSSAKARRCSPSFWCIWQHLQFHNVKVALCNKRRHRMPKGQCSDSGQKRKSGKTFAAAAACGQSHLQRTVEGGEKKKYVYIHRSKRR